MPAPHQLHLKKQPLVVGALSDRSLLGGEIAPAECDLVELRLDALGSGAGVENFCERHEYRLPILLTARDPAEGGHHDLGAEQRAGLLREFLPRASAIDIELRSLDALAAVWSEARERGVTRVASCHDFAGTPGLDTLRAGIAQAHEAGADVAKFAFRINEPRDLAVLSAILRVPAPLPLAVMGMGALAPSSRLLAMQLGSCLNYGFLGSTPSAPGQWPARLLMQVRDASPVA
jgi:3-dehydroquinate dehydratase-1